MLCRIKGKKAQAAVEIAFVASLMIAAFAALISMTEMINRRQNHIQQVFRAHLKKAKETTGLTKGEVADYYYLTPNIPDPYVPGDVGSASTGNSVLWTVKDPTEQPGDPTPVTGYWTGTENLKNANIPYVKTLTRTETPGNPPEAWHSVTRQDTGVTRGEYAP